MLLKEKSCVVKVNVVFGWTVPHDNLRIETIVHLPCMLC